MASFEGEGSLAVSQAGVTTANLIICQVDIWLYIWGLAVASDEHGSRSSAAKRFS